MWISAVDCSARRSTRRSYEKEKRGRLKPAPTNCRCLEFESRPDSDLHGGLIPLQRDRIADESEVRIQGSEPWIFVLHVVANHALEIPEVEDICQQHDAPVGQAKGIVNMRVHRRLPGRARPEAV